MTDIIDLTKISVKFNFELDTLDAVLLVTTGGVGYLARAAYRHFSDKSIRDIQLQRENLVRVLDEAQNKGARSIIVRVHPDVPIYAPSDGEMRFLDRTPSYNELEITFG
jgi:hypothetical protein